VRKSPEIDVAVLRRRDMVVTVNRGDCPDIFERTDLNVDIGMLQQQLATATAKVAIAATFGRNTE